MILSIMDRNNIRGFTYWEEVQGRGSKNGEPHYGSHAWPTLNSAILAMVPDEKVDPFLDLLHKMDLQYVHSYGISRNQFDKVWKHLL